MVQEASGMEKLAGKVSEAGDEANKVQDEAQREAGKEAVQVEDRRLMVLGARAEEEQEGDDEEEFVFDEADPEDGLRKGWFAVARYYSGQSFPVKVLFSDLFRIWGDGTARELGSNRYLLEFSTEDSLNFVLRGGPGALKEMR
jgi:hypothetical protein